LRGRGLGDEIIKCKRLGYVPLRSDGRFYEASLEDWGLDPAHCAKDRVRIPNGILIPWFEGSTLWRLALKRPDQPKGKDYGQVLGSGEGLFNVDAIQYDTPTMMVEAEFCAMAVEQESDDLIACVATGSTTRGRLSRWVAELHLASYVLQSFDEDESGDEGAEYWEQALKHCQRWSPYIAKDPNDILLKKFLPDRWECSLREWVGAGIISMESPIFPSCKVAYPIQTIPLIEQGKREYRGRMLSLEEAQNVSGEPMKPDFDCAFGCKSGKTNRTVWTWSSLAGECICVDCLSPVSWSERKRKYAWF